jgi:small-conductance mechanosensitive channel
MVRAFRQEVAMPVLAHLQELLRYPLFQLGGGTVTPGRLLTGLLIVLIMVAIAQLAARAVSRLMARREVATGIRFAVAKMIRYALILLGLLIAMGNIGLKLDALFAGSAVLLLGIGFGLQTIAQNFVAGLILLVERPVSKGDFVHIGATFGSVADIGLRATRVVTRDEVTIIVPNSELVTAQVVNHSVPTTNLRIAVSVGLAYGSDPRTVERVLLEVARAEPVLLPSPAPEVRFDSFGDSSLDFTLLAWIADPRRDQEIASRLRFALTPALAAAGLTIPFPQRDLHVKSGLELLAAAK